MRPIPVVRSKGRMFASAVLGAEPKFTHDCKDSCCAFHGRFWLNQELKAISWDVWISSPLHGSSTIGSLILRSGDDGPQYSSLPLDMGELCSPFAEVLGILRLTDDLIADRRI